MKVLWITNVPISEHRKLLDNDFNQGGGWMDAAFEKVSKNTNIEIGLATVYPCKSLIKKEKGKIVVHSTQNLRGPRVSKITQTFADE